MNNYLTGYTRNLLIQEYRAPEAKGGLRFLEFKGQDLADLQKEEGLGGVMKFEISEENDDQASGRKTYELAATLTYHYSKFDA